MSDPFPYARATALVTGGSSGIGRAVARALAARGVPRLVLVARDAGRLAEAAAAMPGPSVETVALDLARHDAAGRLRAETERLGVTVDLLVNAAGIGSAGPFHDPEGPDPVAVLDVNARAVTALTAAYLPDMLARGWGGVLNVASTAGQVPVPYSAAYGATKAYVLSLTRALWAETQGGGVRVAGIVPGVTRTNLGGPGRGEVRGPLEGVKIAEPEEVAEAALAALDANDPARVHGTRNALLSAGLGLLPETAKARVIAAFKAEG